MSEQEQPAPEQPAPEKRFDMKPIKKWLNVAVLIAGVVLAGLALYEGWHDDGE